MTYRDQKKYFETLKRYERKFDKTEKEKYCMFLKRHKDEEDLDKISLEYLKKLYEKYYFNRPKKDYSDFFKKPEK
jgi:hypothetical protein